MLLSMTGFGKSEAIYKGEKIHVEIKSLNSKSMDISTHISSMFLEKDLEIRSLLSEQLKRGKVDLNLWTENTEAANVAHLSGEVVHQYISQIRQLSETEQIEQPKDWWAVLSHLPNITQTPEMPELSDEEWQTIKETVQTAIDNLISFRKQEGEAVTKKFNEKLHNIGEYLEEVKNYESGRIDKIKAQILSGLKELPEVNYDKGRLEQEMIYYIEKLDINEEKQRLTNHLHYFAETIEQPQSQGKKLGFIAQEMGREINTLGSKSNQAEMQNLVVKMKDELEQIKEQVLNVL
jgi:uncharacterized protein (TIGR00255 family)